MNNYILDTHTILWYLGGDSMLSPVAGEIISQPENNIFISLASLWEIAIKNSLGKLDLPRPFGELMPSLLEEGFELLPIQVENLIIINSLPFHHSDPFDRLIIAQSLSLNYPVISRDTKFDAYGVTRYWDSF